MKSKIALKQALADLVSDLYEFTFDRGKLAVAVERWAANNFQELGISVQVDMETEKRGGEDVKAHYVRDAVISSAIEMASQCGLGEEEQKMPWSDRISARRDYVPGFYEDPAGMPFKELRLSYVCLKRRPTSWYRDESAEVWMNKLIKRKKK